MSDGQHEFRRVKPDGSALRARIVEETHGHRVEVQWLNPNGQPAHQPLKLGLAVAPDLLTELASFGREMHTRLGS